MQKPAEKLIAFASTVRVQNVTALLLAQLWVAKRMFCPDCSYGEMLWSHRFILMILSTAAVISAGYLIDNFYNLRRDMINRPQRSLREQKLGMTAKLYLYFTLNLTGVALAWLISWRAALFTSVYIFLIWLYFHKGQNKSWIHEIGPPFLIMFPFFGVMLFFKQWNAFILWSGWSVFLSLIMKELIKEHLTLKGDLSNNINSLLVRYGEAFTRRIFGLVLLLWTITWIGIWQVDAGKYFRFFLVFLSVWMIVVVYLFYRRRQRAAYGMIRLFVALGILSIWLV